MSLFACDVHGYTLLEKCAHCGKATHKPGPAKYSPEDTYGKYRRKLKLLNMKEGARP